LQSDTPMAGQNAERPKSNMECSRTRIRSLGLLWIDIASNIMARGLKAASQSRRTPERYPWPLPAVAQPCPKECHSLSSEPAPKRQNFSADSWSLYSTGFSKPHLIHLAVEDGTEPHLDISQRRARQCTMGTFIKVHCQLPRVLALRGGDRVVRHADARASLRRRCYHNVPRHTGSPRYAARLPAWRCEVATPY
jgi:hypothetical protein